MTVRENYNTQRELIDRWDKLPLLKQREIVSTLWEITLLAPDKPQGRASNRMQEDKVVMVPR